MQATLKRSIKNKIILASFEKSNDARIVMEHFNDRSLKKESNFFEFYSPNVLEAYAKLNKLGGIGFVPTIEPCDINSVIMEKLNDAIVMLPTQKCVVWRDEAGVIGNPNGAAIITQNDSLIFAQNGRLEPLAASSPVIVNLTQGLNAIPMKITPKGCNSIVLGIKALWCSLSTGNISREGGPAIIANSGVNIYLKDGMLHRDANEGYAIESYDVNALSGKKLPAKSKSGSYFEYGKRVNKKDY